MSINAVLRLAVVAFAMLGAAAFGGRGGGSIGPFYYLCDNLSVSCVAAYSANRQLRSSYSGKAFKVNNGSTSADIGFTSGHLTDMAAYSAFVGAGSPSAVTVYNQGTIGSGADCIQNTSASQMAFYAHGPQLGLFASGEAPPVHAGDPHTYCRVAGVSGVPVGNAARTIVFIGYLGYTPCCGGMIGLSEALGSTPACAMWAIGGNRASQTSGSYYAWIDVEQAYAAGSSGYSGYPTINYQYSAALIPAVFIAKYDGAGTVTSIVNGVTLYSGALPSTPSDCTGGLITGGSDASVADILFGTAGDDTPVPGCFLESMILNGATNSADDAKITTDAERFYGLPNTPYGSALAAQCAATY